LKKQGIDPDAMDEQPKKKDYDDSFMKQYQYDYGAEEEEKTDQVEESKEEVLEEPKK